VIDNDALHLIIFQYYLGNLTEKYGENILVYFSETLSIISNLCCLLFFAFIFTAVFCLMTLTRQDKTRSLLKSGR